MGLQQIPSKGGIPSGNTASRPSSPATGDTFYNGELGILEIWTGSSWFPCSAPPATPINIVATDASTGDAYTSTAGKLSVAFSAGSGGGQPTNYIAYTTSGGFSTSGSASPLILTGLTPGTAYTTYVVAQNGFGNSAASANATAATPTTLPQAPTIGTATDTTAGGTLSVTFTAGNNGGKSITNYQYQLNGAGSYTAFSPTQTTSPLTISGLTNGTSYTVKLKAVNANGAGAESSASNSATPTQTITIDYLVVAGGGGGGVLGGGGGAGGLRSTVTGSGGSPGTVETALSVSSMTNYTVTVGAGGGGAASEAVRGTNGSNSVFSTVTSVGGGGGGSDSSLLICTGQDGGSGGGKGNAPGATGGIATANQGFNGGTSGTSGTGAGGGGAGSAGSPNASGPADGGAGGNGKTVAITGSSVAYAGGGGGGGRRDSGTGRQIGGAGGSGGGGNGGSSDHSPGLITAQNGTTNLGGGGGGAGYGPANYNGTGGSGGKGVVILRWLTSAGSITVGAGLTADATGTDGSYSYKRFTDGSGNVSFA